MGFADPAADERPFARRIADELGLRHEEFLAEKTDVAGLFEEVWRSFDEPFADSSALPMLELCREIRKRVKVAVGGDGGDEVWCGYPWHRALVRIEHSFAIPLSLRRLAAQAGPFLGRKRREQGKLFAARDRLDAWALLKTGLTEKRARFLPVQAETPCPREYFSTAAKQIGDATHPLDWACRMDLATYLPDDLMVKADRASMRWGLELREPLLDHEFTGWGLSLPILMRFDVQKRQGKQLSRHYLAQRLPPETTDRPKQGFTPPLPAWLSGPLNEWKTRAVAQLERGELYPVALPGSCKSWSDCAIKLGDQHNQFLWRIVCFAGWKASRSATLNGA
jgi:asparagine synthase (glutamine-hydrolysing)